MGCAQSPGQKEITEPSLNFALKRGGTEFKDSYDASERISRQCIAEFSKQIFGTYSPDPTKHKMVWRGTAGPRTVNYDNPNTGPMQFRDDCNVIPEFDSFLFRQRAATVPDSYQAIKSFNAWSRETDHGTSGMDSFWGWSPDAAQCILQWKQGIYSGGGSFTVSQSSQIYEKAVASGDMSLLFKWLRIGATGSGSSVFDSSSAYRFGFEWKASATINATSPGKAYNFVLLEQYRNGPISPSYPGHQPLTGEAKSPLSNVITSIVLMYGLSMTATFDAATYRRIEEQSTDVVSFGFFSIGMNQTYTKTTWDQSSYSITVTCDESPLIVAYHTDTLG